MHDVLKSNAIVVIYFCLSVDLIVFPICDNPVAISVDFDESFGALHFDWNPYLVVFLELLGAQG